MKQPRKFYIYSRSSLYFLIFLVVSMLITIIQLLIEDDFFENLTALLAACSLLVTVGWIAFSSMGRIEIRNSEIVVNRNFKRYRLDPYTIVVRLGEKNTSRGITNYPIYVEGKVIGNGTSDRSVTLKFLGTKRKNKELLKYYQEHLQAQVEANKALEQETTEVDFEQIVLASKDRQQFPLRDLVEFGADQGNLKKTVFYHPKENKLRKKCSISHYLYPEWRPFLWHLSVNGSSILSWPHPASAIVWIDAWHRYMAIETQKAEVYSECHSL